MGHLGLSILVFRTSGLGILGLDNLGLGILGLKLGDFVYTGFRCFGFGYFGTLRNSGLGILGLRLFWDFG